MIVHLPFALSDVRERCRRRISGLLSTPAAAWVRRHMNVLVFVAGFVFDYLTIRRIDSLTDIAIQILYIGLLTVVLVLQYRERRGQWSPGRWNVVWRFNVEALHFLYGGLLSAYVVLYLKSSSGARPVVFFILLALLLVLNEMPQIRRYGYRLRLGLFAFCLCSFLIYFVPLLVGRISDLVFCFSLVLSAAAVWWVAGLLAKHDAEPVRVHRRLFAPAGAVLLTIGVLYFLRLIPPVPLSIQFHGIFHTATKNDNVFVLRSPRQSKFLFWRRDSRPFWRRPEDSLSYFVRVFAPARFRHKVMIRWEHFNERTDTYETTDLLPIAITGGRAEGYRGTTSKTNFTPGRWRVSAETEDGRAIGVLSFRVETDLSDEPRIWREIEM